MGCICSTLNVTHIVHKFESEIVVSPASETHVGLRSSNFRGRCAPAEVPPSYGRGWDNESVKRWAILMWSHLGTLIGKPALCLTSRASQVYSLAIAESLVLIHGIFVLEGIPQILFMDILSTHIRSCKQDDWPVPSQYSTIRWFVSKWALKTIETQLLKHK